MSSTPKASSPRPTPGDGISRASSISQEAPEHIGLYGPAAITFVAAPTPRRRSRASSEDGGRSPASSIKNCSFSDDHKMVCYSDLWQPPVVRQWLVDGRLYREAEERTPSRFELFFESRLVYLGRVRNLEAGFARELNLLLKNVFQSSQLAKHFGFISLQPNALAMQLKSVVSLGVDDVAQRVQTLIIMITLIGYSANASAISIGHGEEEASTAEEERMPQRALVAAVAFFVIAKACRVITSLHYAWALPDFRESHLFRGFGTLIVALIFMGIIWATSLKTAAILAIFGIFAEVGGKLLIGVGISVERRRARILRESQRKEENEGALPTDGVGNFLERRTKSRMIPAINIEHLIERNGAFVTVVLGESVVSLLYVASHGSLGASKTFGRATLALVVSFIMNAVYFDSALSRRYMHAIRRHWASHVLWDTLTWPLSTGLILASAAVSKMVTEEETPRGVRWQYGVGLGISLLCITTMGMLHRSLDVKGSTRLSQVERAIARLVAAIIFILIPLAKDISDLSFLFVYAGVASALVIFEIYAKIGNEEKEEVDHHAVDADEHDAQEEGEKERVTDRSMDTEKSLQK